MRSDIACSSQVGIGDTQSTAMAALSQTVELYIKCEGLKDADTFSKSDPFAVVFLKGFELGRTETINNNLNPSFKVPIQVEYLFEEVQNLRICIYDSDGSSRDLSKHDKLGEATAPLGRIMGSRGQQVN